MGLNQVNEQVFDIDYGDQLKRATIRVRLIKRPQTRFRLWLGMKMVVAGIRVAGMGVEYNDGSESNTEQEI